jgi:hypothetical protein
LRQAYDYWQDQPGSYSFPKPAPPKKDGIAPCSDHQHPTNRHSPPFASPLLSLRQKERTRLAIHNLHPPQRGHGAFTHQCSPGTQPTNLRPPRRLNSRSMLQGYPSQGYNSASITALEEIPRFIWHSLGALRPKYRPVPPFILTAGSGRGPASEAHSFSQSALSPNSPVELCAPAYAALRCLRLPPAPGSIASSPVHPKAQYVRPFPILQPCPFGGPVLSIEKTTLRAW